MRLIRKINWAFANFNFELHYDIVFRLVIKHNPVVFGSQEQISRVPSLALYCTKNSKAKKTVNMFQNGHSHRDVI
jgi:hypothetical protein